jgi:hypothetical protein
VKLAHDRVEAEQGREADVPQSRNNARIDKFDELHKFRTERPVRRTLRERERRTAVERRRTAAVRSFLILLDEVIEWGGLRRTITNSEAAECVDRLLACNLDHFGDLRNKLLKGLANPFTVPRILSGKLGQTVEAATA